jgi:pilus assembly protein Flp/PilA
MRSYKDASKRNASMSLLSLFLRNESGATAIEYAVIALLVSVAAVGAMTALGGKLTGTFESVANQFK